MWTEKIWSHGDLFSDEYRKDIIKECAGNSMKEKYMQKYEHIGYMIERLEDERRYLQDEIQNPANDIELEVQE